MPLSPLQRSILAGILHDRTTFAELPWDGAGTGRGCGAYRAKIRMAREGLVAPELAAWLGRTPTASDRTMACRAYELLESLGLILRHGGSSRTTHLSLTPNGERLAKGSIDVKSK